MGAEKDSLDIPFLSGESWRSQSRNLWREVGKACGLKHPRAPLIGELSQEEKATPAVLQFLRETQVGQLFSIAALRRGRGVEHIAEVGEEDGKVHFPASLRCLPLYSPCFWVFFCSFSFGGHGK